MWNYFCQCDEGFSQDGDCLNTRVLWRFEDLVAEAGSEGRVFVATHETPTDGTFAAFFIDVKYTKDPLEGGDIRGLFFFLFFPLVWVRFCLKFKSHVIMKNSFGDKWEVFEFKAWLDLYFFKFVLMTCRIP